jgi:activator of 2-hydroxyglutaryl-CoA dehydratase
MGIDIGSTTSKCVILSDGSEIVSASIILGGTGTSGQKTAVNEALANASLSIDAITYTVSTAMDANHLRLRMKISANSAVTQKECISFILMSAPLLTSEGRMQK